MVKFNTLLQKLSPGGKSSRQNISKKKGTIRSRTMGNKANRNKTLLVYIKTKTKSESR